MKNSLLVQYYFNLEDKLSDSKLQRDEKYGFIRRTLMSRGKEYALQLTHRDHLEFLKYWFNTQDKQQYADSRK